MQNWRKSISVVQGIENGGIFWFINLELGDKGKLTQWFRDQNLNKVIGNTLLLVYQSCSMRFYVCWLSKLFYILGNSGCDYACVPNVRGGAVGWGTPLQAWRSWVDFPWYHWDVPLSSSFQQHYEPGVYSAPNRNEYQGYLLGSKGDRCIKSDNLATFTCRLSRNSGNLNVLEP
jgi:hypothetical protein